MVSIKSIGRIQPRPPSLLPIQFFWAALVESGQSILSRPFISPDVFLLSSIKSVILKNHCSRSFWITSVPHLSHSPLITCSLARTVLQEGHQSTEAFALYAKPAL